MRLISQGRGDKKRGDTVILANREIMLPGSRHYDGSATSWDGKEMLIRVIGEEIDGEVRKYEVYLSRNELLLLAQAVQNGENSPT